MCCVVSFSISIGFPQTQPFFSFSPTFRRTGPSSLLNIAVYSFIGVVSGNYIFGEPIRQYWAEQERLEVEAKEKGTPLPSPRRKSES